MMFFKGSRYKDLPEMRATDAEGQTARSKALRWMPNTPGTFLHTVNQTDRLDLLAYKYYEEPKKWWLICDANPDFANPFDLLDRDPIIQEIFTLESSSGENKWPILIKALKDLRGIIEVQTDVFQATLEVTYNQKEITREEITDVIVSGEFEIKPTSKKERIGQKIIIPPNQIV